MPAEATDWIEGEMWADVLASGEAAMTEELARWLLNLHLTESQQQRVQILAERSNAGTLTDKERLEVEQYRRVGDLLSIIKAQAKLVLRRKGRLV